ncbi:hypothetical protein OUZ56_016664 [Daphnia magna]|uniref:Uncharacterized protein n=1 Tax=Daphnia magna TaxID=35525 RepID=A0ABR0AR64_9CRUS|nr:hypothetical protein OUZ56_016664 [Daphnia magna]
MESAATRRCAATAAKAYLMLKTCKLKYLLWRDLLSIRSLIVQVSCLGKAFVCSNSRNFISFLHLSLFKLHLVTDINMVGGRGRASILSDLI